MFRQLANWYEQKNPGISGAVQVFSLHPLQLTRFLEEIWLMRTDRGARPGAAIPRRCTAWRPSRVSRTT